MQFTRKCILIASIVEQGRIVCLHFFALRGKHCVSVQGLCSRGGHSLFIQCYYTKLRCCRETARWCTLFRTVVPRTSDCTLVSGTLEMRIICMQSTVSEFDTDRQTTSRQFCNSKDGYYVINWGGRAVCSDSTVQFREKYIADTTIGQLYVTYVCCLPRRNVQPRETLSFHDQPTLVPLNPFGSYSLPTVFLLYFEVWILV